MKLNEFKINKSKKNPFCKINKQQGQQKNSLFDLMEIYLNNNELKEWCEIALTIIQLFQVLSFAINEKVHFIYKYLLK